MAAPFSIRCLTVFHRESRTHALIVPIKTPVFISIKYRVHSPRRDSDAESIVNTTMYQHPHYQHNCDRLEGNCPLNPKADLSKRFPAYQRFPRPNQGSTLYPGECGPLLLPYGDISAVYVTHLRPVVLHPILSLQMLREW